MKISVTEEFLWDIYTLLSKTGDVAASVLNPRISKFIIGIENPIFNKYKKQKRKIKFDNLVYYLKKKNYIKVENSQGKKAVIITKAGLGKALKASFKIEGKIKRKDGKWIMLMFDIPQTNKKARNLLKSILHNLGYRLFQQSVWVTPHDVSARTEELLNVYSLDKYVKIFLIEEI